MAKNLEIKVKVDSLKRIKSLIKQNKIELVEILKQKDIYYKIDAGLLKLRIENGKQTLIFYKRNEKSPKRWSDYYLLEISADQAAKFLGKFLYKLIEVEKTRELYLYKNTRIHLDKVKGLGSYLELETRVVNGLKDAEKRFNYLFDLLELKKYKEIRNSYKNLLMNKIQK